jgi:multidrug transporter EmrE-like cation transporter
LDLSMVYPMVSIGYIAVAVASYFWLGETVTLVRWAGILVICAGVVMISRT